MGAFLLWVVMMLSGWINLYKPEGITSAWVLNRLKRGLPKKTKIGHAGTLDKFACGVLPVAVGFATKTVSMLMGAKKGYTFTVKWGVQTTTDDRDGDFVQEGGAIPTLENIEATLQNFRGTLQQMPPTYSALKIDGKRASDLARMNEVVALKPREIVIHALSLVEHAGETSTFYVECGKGTYVRALARDIAAALGTVCYVTFLRRDFVRNFRYTDAFFLENKDEKVYYSHNGDTSAIIPIRAVLDDIPAVSFESSDLSRISMGQSVTVNLDECETVFALNGDDVVAIGYVKDQCFYPKNVNIDGV